MSLAYYYALLSKKQNELKRLEACNSSLQSKQGEFAENQNLMTKPPLTVMTWNGNWAQSFDQIREKGILSSYKDIETTQFNSTFKVLAGKIIEIRLEIERIQQIIAQLLAEQRARSLSK